MKFISEVKAYAALSGEQKRFVKAKVLEGESTPDEWLSFFGQIAEFDTYVDAGRKSLKIGCGAFAILFVVGIVLVGVAGPVLLVFALVGAIALGITALVQSRVDLPNNFRGLTVPFVSILKEEMEPGEQLHLRLDLRGKTIPDKEDRAARTSTASGDDRFFEDTWMSGRAMLADGSRLEWSIVDYVRERKRTKRSASGKTKAKTKHKIKTAVEARLSLRHKDYAAIQAATPNDWHDRIDFKTGGSRNTVRVKRVIVSTDLKAMLDLDQVLEAVGRCYAQVRLNKPGDK
jgi:hypothetical protein